VGLDFELARHFYLGPFLSFSIDQYSDVSVDGSAFEDAAFDVDGEIEDKGLHHWLVLGVRAAYAP
jgi:hypothetical protein